ncbi:MAG: hypothetical protein ACYTGC_15025, partial [Planctomycetota bacterium]
MADHHVRILSIPVLAVLLTATFVGIARSAAGQSQADLRRENQRLATQVGDLEAQLQAARNRIAELEAQIASLREAMSRRATGPGAPMPPLEAERVTIDESVPTAS